MEYIMNSVIFNGQAVQPSKVVCVGRNYTEHIAELNNETPDQMVVFIKPNSSISHTLQACHQEQLHYEGEMCFIVGDGRFVGVGFGLDLTKRELQSHLKAKNLPWERAKSFDGAGVFQEFVTLPDNIDWSQLSLTLHIEDVLIQQGSVMDMLFKPEAVLNNLSSFITLEDGDIVMTGTPKGVGKVTANMEFVGRILHGDNVLVESSWISQS